MRFIIRRRWFIIQRMHQIGCDNRELLHSREKGNDLCNTRGTFGVFFGFIFIIHSHAVVVGNLLPRILG